MSTAGPAPNNLLAPDLAELGRQFAAAKTEVPELVSSLKEAQFNWRPSPQSWSIAECLLHLNILGDRYIPLIEKAIEKARARGLVGKGPFGYGFLGEWLLDNTEPPPRRKFKAPRLFTPAYGQPITAVLPTFLHLQDQLARQTEQANGLDLERIKVPAPGWGPVRLNLHITLAWMAAHQRRHLWQARQVRNHAMFPITPGVG
jgi:hypothetical protein